MGAFLFGKEYNITMSLFDELPAYLYCPDCDEKHFLSLNKDIHGKWSAGYVDFENHTAVATTNNSDTLEEAETRLKYSVDRYNKFIKNSK